jgi:hypothetical protein
MLVWFKSRAADLGQGVGELKGGLIGFLFAIEAGGRKGAGIEVEKDILTAPVEAAARLGEHSIIIINSIAELEFALSFGLNGTLASEMGGGDEEDQ